MLALFHTLTPFMEIALIAFMINYIISFFWNTRSMDLVLGLLAFLLIYASSSLLNFPVLNKLMYFVANIAALAVVVIFQPELRVALSKLSLKGKREKELNAYDDFLEQLSYAVYRLGGKRIGALIVLENEDSLNDFSQKGVMLNAQFSPELLESIFTESSPLHDGAIVIRDQTVVAATVILPLAEESLEVTRDMGTRHRAALGISESTDALIIVVSEESGKVSIAREGVITKGIKVDRFKGIIRSIYTPTQEEKVETSFNIRKWLRE